MRDKTNELIKRYGKQLCDGTITDEQLLELLEGVGSNLLFEKSDAVGAFFKAIGEYIPDEVLTELVNRAVPLSIARLVEENTFLRNDNTLVVKHLLAYWIKRSDDETHKLEKVPGMTDLFPTETAMAGARLMVDGVVKNYYSQSEYSGKKLELEDPKSDDQPDDQSDDQKVDDEKLDSVPSTENGKNLNGFWQVTRQYTEYSKPEFQKREENGDYSNNKKDLYQMGKTSPCKMYIDGVPLCDIFKTLEVSKEEDLTEEKIKIIFNDYLLQNLGDNNKAYIDEYADLLSKIMYQGGLLNPFSQSLSDVAKEKSFSLKSENLDCSLHISTASKGVLVFEEMVSVQKATRTEGALEEDPIENPDGSPLLTGACKYQVILDTEKNEQNDTKGILKYKVTDYCTTYNNKELQSVLDKRNIFEKFFDLLASIFHSNKYMTEEEKQDKNSLTRISGGI